MADELRIGLSELLRKAMIEQDASFLKEGVRVLSQALMELDHPPQRLPVPRLGHSGGHGGVEGAKGKGFELLPFAVGAQKASRAGALCGGPGGLRSRYLHAQGGRVGEGFRDGGHLQEPGQ